MAVPRSLTVRRLAHASRTLAATDPVLGESLARYGTPPLWARDPSYATLVHLILEQQVSLASAQAAFDRLGAAIGVVTPDALLTLDDTALRRIGFSRQKTGYARELASAVLDGFSLESLAALPDDEVRAALTVHRGIGRWTADIYLTMCLLRDDVWPNGDLALATAAREIGLTAQRPSNEELAKIAERWHPYRAIAARILWQHYLRERNQPLDQ